MSICVDIAITITAPTEDGTTLYFRVLPLVDMKKFLDYMDWIDGPDAVQWLADEGIFRII